MWCVTTLTSSGLLDVEQLLGEGHEVRVLLLEGSHQEVDQRRLPVHAFRVHQLRARHKRDHVTRSVIT